MISTRQKSSDAASSAFVAPVNSTKALNQTYRPSVRDIKPLPMRRKSAMSEDTKPSAQALAALMNQATPPRFPLSPVRSCSNGAASIPIASSHVQSYRFPAHKTVDAQPKPIQPPSLPYLLPSPVLVSPFAMLESTTVILPDLSSIQLAPIRSRPAPRQTVRLRRPSIIKSHSAPTRRPPTPVISKHPTRGCTSPSLASISLTQAFKLAERSQAKMEQYSSLRLAPISSLPLPPKRKASDDFDFKCDNSSIVAKRRGRIVQPLNLDGCEGEKWFVV